jgi:hypothetical protein
MSDSDKNWERQLGSPPQCSSAAMSFQSAIPWQVALRQSLPPLHRLATILNNPLCRTMIFQRTVTTPLTSCLTPWVHFSHPLSPATPPYMRVRIRRFDQLIPRSACGLGVCGSRTPCGFTSRVSIRCGFTALCLPKACRSRMASAIPPSRTQALLTLPIVQAFVARATTTPSADFCPAFAMSYDTTSHPRQPRQISRDKLDRLPRTTAGFTTSALDGYGLRDHLLARPAP